MIRLARASAIEFQRQESLSCIFMKARTFLPFDEGQKRLGNDLIVHAVSTVETMVVLIVLHVFLEAIAGCVLISEEGDHLVIGICILELVGLHFLQLFAQFSGHKEFSCAILPLGEEGKGLHFVLP